MRKKISFLIVAFFLNVIVLTAKPLAFKEIQKVTYGKDNIHTYTHTPSGVEVIWIENKDKNKSFALGVKTPTKDSSGVNHIIEHTIFTGSKKYPNPSLFFDASERYPNIYMNAMTTGDMTIYPFCTPYEACFEMLMNVYLDSILNPNMKNQSNSFFEESFHYNPRTKQYGGVVYNEMKGAKNDINRMIFRSIREVVYKDTSYENDSGGDPNQIPSLTYEQFLETYNTYYYPGNMKIILYGDLPIENTLKTIDHYFSGYVTQQPSVNLSVQPKTQRERQMIGYPNTEDSHYIIKSFLLKDKLSTKQALMLDLWVEAYMVSPTSYFQRQIQQYGIKRVNIYKDEALTYPVYSIVLSDIPSSKVEEYTKLLDKIIESTLEKKMRNELAERDTLEKAKLAMYQLDQSPLRGIQIAESIFDAWAHDREEYQYFVSQQVMDTIEALDEAAKIKLLKDSISYDMTLIPEEKQHDQDPMRDSEISENDWKNILDAMERWQNQKPITPLPLIDLQSLLLTPENLGKTYTKNHINYITIPMTSQLAETSVYLDTRHIQKENLPYLFLYEYLLTESAREESPFKAMLTTKISSVDNQDNYKPYMKINIVSSIKNKDHARVLREARSNLLARDFKWYENKLNNFVYLFKDKMNTDILGTLTMMNMGSLEGAKRYDYEKTYPLYNECKQLLQIQDKSWINKIREVDSLLYVPRQVTIGINCEKVAISSYEKNWSRYFKAYGTKINKEQYHYEWNKMPKNSVYFKPTNVDYLMYTYQKKDGQMEGIDYILASYLTKNYLQPHIRIQKGAYGSGMRATFPRTFSLYTYRDPDYLSSIDIINKMEKTLNEPITRDDFEATKADALSTFHREFGFLESQLSKAKVLQELYFEGIDLNYLIKTQQEIIEAMPKEITDKKDLIEDFIKDASKSICTDKKVEENRRIRIYKD